jgi:hypothetical protein
MQISPWASIGLNVLYAILTGLTIPLVDALGFPHYDAQIVAWAGLMAVPMNIILHSYSSSQPGPAAPADPPVVLAAQTVAALPSDAPETSIKIAKAIATRAIADHKP